MPGVLPEGGVPEAVTAGVGKALRAGARLSRAAFTGMMGLGVVTVLEGVIVRGKLLRTATATAPPSSGLYGGSLPGPELVLALLGDSLAVGLGADRTEETLGARLATALATNAGQPVRLHTLARIGAESVDLDEQIARLRARTGHLDAALVVIGGNDVMHLKSIPTAVRALAEAVLTLRRMGCEVIVATCPDMGTVRPFSQPLGFIAHWLSRILATSQTIAVLRAGGRTVSLADMLGPVFRQEPALMFAGDHMHPSAHGYERAATVLLPSLCAAAGIPVPTALRVPHQVHTQGRAHLVAWLAFQASRNAGTESNELKGRHGPLTETGRRVFTTVRQNRFPGSLRRPPHAPAPIHAPT